MEVCYTTLKLVKCSIQHSRSYTDPHPNEVFHNDFLKKNKKTNILNRDPFLRLNRYMLICKRNMMSPALDRLDVYVHLIVYF